MTWLHQCHDFYIKIVKIKISYGNLKNLVFYCLPVKSEEEKVCNRTWVQIILNKSRQRVFQQIWGLMPYLVPSKVGLKIQKLALVIYSSDFQTLIFPSTTIQMSPSLASWKIRKTSFRESRQKTVLNTWSPVPTDRILVR